METYLRQGWKNETGNCFPRQKTRWCTLKGETWLVIQSRKQIVVQQKQEIDRQREREMGVLVGWSSKNSTSCINVSTWLNSAEKTETRGTMPASSSLDMDRPRVSNDNNDVRILYQHTHTHTHTHTLITAAASAATITYYYLPTISSVLC